MKMKLLTELIQTKGKDKKEKELKKEKEIINK